MFRYYLLSIAIFYMKLSMHVHSLSSQVVTKTTCTTKTVLYTKEMCYTGNPVCVTITYTKLEYECQNNLFTIVNSALILSESVSSGSPLVSLINNLTQSEVIYSNVLNSTLLFSITPFITNVTSIEDSQRSTSFLISESTLNYMSTITGFIDNLVTSFFSTSRLIIEPTLAHKSTIEYSTEIESDIVETSFSEDGSFVTPTAFISQIFENSISLSFPNSTSKLYLSLLVEESETTYLKSSSADFYDSIVSESVEIKSDKTIYQTLFSTKELKTVNLLDSVSVTTNPDNFFTKTLIHNTTTPNSISIQSSSVIEIYSNVLTSKNIINSSTSETSISDVSAIHVNSSMFALFSITHVTESFSKFIASSNISDSSNINITEMIHNSVLDVINSSNIYRTPTLIFSSNIIFNSVPSFSSFFEFSSNSMFTSFGSKYNVSDSISVSAISTSSLTFLPLFTTQATESFSNSLPVKSILNSLNRNMTEIVQSSELDVINSSDVYRTPTLIFSSKTVMLSSVPIFSSSFEFSSSSIFTSFGSKSNISDSISISAISTSSLRILPLFTTQATESFSNSLPVKSILNSLNRNMTEIVQSSVVDVINSSDVYRTPTLIFSSKTDMFNFSPVVSRSLEFNSSKIFTSTASESKISDSLKISTMNTSSLTLSPLFTTQATDLFSNSFLIKSVFKSINSNNSLIIQSTVLDVINSTLLERTPGSYLVLSTPAIFSSKSSIFNSSHSFSHSLEFNSSYTVNINHNVTIMSSQNVSSANNVTVMQMDSSLLPSYINTNSILTANFNYSYFSKVLETSFVASESFVVTKLPSVGRSSDMITPSSSLVYTFVLMSSYVPCWATSVVTQMDTISSYDQVDISTVSQDFKSMIQPTKSLPLSTDTANVKSSNADYIINMSNDIYIPNQFFTSTLSMCLIYYSTLILNSLGTSSNDVSHKITDTVFVSTSPNTVWFNTDGYSLQVTSSILDGISNKKASTIAPSFSALECSSQRTVVLFSDNLIISQSIQDTLNQTAMQVTIPSIIPVTYLETVVCLSYTVVETIIMYSSVLPITTTKPETTLIPVDVRVRISLNINESIDVTSIEIRKDLERKLVETFISLKSVGKRKRRLVSINNVTVVIEKTQRIGQEVIVEFTIAENNAYIKASDVASVFNYLSESGLGRKLGYPVNGPVSVSLPTVMPYRLSDVIGIVVVESANNNLSHPLNQFYFENNLTQYYNQYHNESPLVAKIIFSKIEVSLQIYIELVFVLNGVSQNASSIVLFFSNKNLSELSTSLSIQVLEKPFVVNSIRVVKQTDIIKIVIKTPNNLNISDPGYMQDLSLKLSLIYMMGQRSKRVRRATGSVVADIRSINDLYNGNHQTNFVIIDQGVVVNASEAVAIMNKISVADMSALLKMQVVSPPETILPVLGTSGIVVKYWIIAAVIVPIVFIAFLCFGVIWKCKSNSAPRKIQPGKIEPEKIMESTNGSNLVSPVRNKKSMLNDSQSLAVPLFSASNERQNDSEHDKSMRRKVKKTPVAVKKQNQVSKKEHINNEDKEDDCDDDEDDDNDDDEEDDEDEIRNLPIVNIRKKMSTPVGKQDSKYSHLENEKSMFPLSPIYQRPKTPAASTDKQFEIKADVVASDELLVPINNFAANVPTFKHMTEMKSLTPAPPVRFRRTIESSMNSFANPTGPLPLLSLKKTSLVSAQQNMTGSPENIHSSLYHKSNKTSEITAMDSDLQHKMEVERQRNKQRQRNQFFKSPSSATAESAFTIKDEVWNREQKKIDDILEPSLSTRKGRKRRRMRRKYKVHISPNAVDGHLMKKMLDVNTDTYKKVHESTQQTVFNSYQDNPNEMESSDTDISMREARHRIHSLLDDTFSAIKNYQKNLIKDEPLIKNTSQKPDFSQKIQAGFGPTPAALPIAPIIGRNAIPVGSTSDSKFLQNTYANPYSPYVNSTPFAEPLLSWDPIERQRFVNQRLGYPVYGQIPTSLTLPYGAPGQNVYVTPVHQRPDGVGNMVWTPHFESHMNPMQPFNIMDRNLLSGFPQTHSTVLDMNDFGDIKRKSGSQPLIRAIKDELQRLSNSAQGRTKVQEFQTRPTMNESVT